MKLDTIIIIVMYRIIKNTNQTIHQMINLMKLITHTKAHHRTTRHLGRHTKIIIHTKNNKGNYNGNKFTIKYKY